MWSPVYELARAKTNIYSGTCVPSINQSDSANIISVSRMSACYKLSPSVFSSQRICCLSVVCMFMCIGAKSLMEVLSLCARYLAVCVCGGGVGVGVCVCACV